MQLRHMMAGCGALALVAAVLLAGAPVAGQDGDDFETPRTAWGHADLTGIWSPGYTLTPLERPAEFGDREFLTDEEVAALEGAQDSSAGRNFRPDSGTVADVEGAYNDEFTGRGKDVIRTGRTSLIVDPPNGAAPAGGRRKRSSASASTGRGGRLAAARSRPTCAFRTRWIRRAAATPTIPRIAHPTAAWASPSRSCAARPARTAASCRHPTP